MSDKHAPLVTPGTPKAAAPAAAGPVRPAGAVIKSPHRKRTRRLKGVSDIRRYFNRNETPYYFFSATNFNVLNMDEWVRNFRFINAVDCFDGLHPNVLVPGETPHEPFGSLEDIVNYLLEHKEVQDYIRKRGPGGKAIFLFFDERTEELCDQLGLEVCFPRASLRTKVDNKINTTRIANRAGVRSVPNVLAKVDSYETLRRVARHLGNELVVQTAFGDSGHTTFFVASREDWDKHAHEIPPHEEIKVMKKIACRGAALEACVTRHGTIVGPLMTELVGFPELTPYRGGWCGNEVFPGTFTPAARNRARASAEAIGDELRKMGYRGYFEVDFLRDLSNNRLYLGELNPRITGASSMTNLSAFAHADAPLFLFHLLEWAGIQYDLDVAALNRRWADAQNIDSWSQLVMKHTEDTVDLVTAAPRSGVYRMGPGGDVVYGYTQTHRRTVERENEGFFLRITRAGDYRYKGCDLGILITPGRLMDEDFRLTRRAKAWIRGIHAHFAATPLPGSQRDEFVEKVAEVGDFKML